MIMFLATHENWLNDDAKVRFILMNIEYVYWLYYVYYLFRVDVYGINLFSFYS